MVEVLVWNAQSLPDSGFVANFEGEEVNSYKVGDITYILYKCTKYDFDAYRVHVRDESHPDTPKYQLHPYNGDQQDPKSYKEPYREADIAKNYPRFLLDLKDFPVLDVDATPPPWKR